MTEKQKKAFLKAEGWRPYKVSDGTYGIDGWRDTKEKHVLESLAPIEFAYRIASRRKRQREYRRLKAAGWEYQVLGDGFGNIYTRWCWSEKRDNGKCLFADTRQEALYRMERQP